MGNFFKSLFSSSKEENTENRTENINTKTDQKNFDIFKYDGIRAQRIGKLQYAIKCFEEALNIQDDFETMGLLVTAYISNQDFDEAFELSNRMVELEPEEPSSYMTRVNVLFMMDREQEAIADCLKVIELDELNNIAWYMLGKAKQSIKDLSGAVADITKAITLKEDFVSAWILRSEVQLEMNQPEVALPDIEKALELVPEEESAYLLRGRIHEALNDFPAATEDYNQALALNPFNEEASLLSASLLIKENKPDEAIAILDEIIELKPDFAKAYSERSKAKSLKGDKEGAQTDQQDAERFMQNEKEEKGEKAASDFNDMYKGGIY